MISSMDDLFNELFGFPWYTKEEKKREEEGLDFLNNFFSDLLKKVSEKENSSEKENKTGKEESITKSDVVSKCNTSPVINTYSSEIDNLKNQLSTICKDTADIKESLKTDTYRDEALQKQIKALAKELKDMQETIDSLNACSDCDADMLADLYEKIYEVAEACENENIGSFDFLHTDELEGFDDDEFEDEDILDSELEETTTSIYDCEEDEDDYSYEDKIKEYVKNSYGFDSFTISDGKEAAIVIPLGDKFNMTDYIVNNITVKKDN